MRPLAEQTVLVTGSSDGLGRRVAEELVERGAEILHTVELAGRLDGREVTVNALHPATLMDTKMVRETSGMVHSSVEEGAEATLRLIADPDLDGVSGRFFNGQREAAAEDQAYDPEARRRLWELSERLTGLA